MCEFAKKFCYAFLLCSLYFSTSATFDLSELELLDNKNNDASTTSDYDYHEDEYYHNDGGNDFWFGMGNIGFAIGASIIGIALLCSCCECCCSRSLKSQSTIVPSVAVTVPKENNSPVQPKIVPVTVTTPTNETTNVRNHTSDRNQMVFSFHATQSTTHYDPNGVPVPNPNFANINQTNIHEQPPPSYYEVVAEFPGP